MLPENCANCGNPFTPVPKEEDGRWILCCNDCQHEIEPPSVGPYKIFLFLGEGAFSEVYLARLENLEWPFALKLLSPSLIDDERAKRWFLREIYTASQLSHPNICTIINHGKNRNAPPSQAKYNDAPFIVMEYIAGKTLRARLDELVKEHKKPDFEEWLNIAIQIAEGLCAAHKKGVIHRDIKPGNIMIGPQGVVKILDFGLAKRSFNPELQVSSSAPTEPIPEAGQRVGTYAYMSPEQITGDPSVDAQSDIFGFGIVLYEIFSGGINPFNKETWSAIYKAITEEEPPSLRHFNPTLPNRLQAIVDKALQKNRSQRYQKTEELLTDLKNLKPDPEPVRKKTHSTLLAIIFLMTFLIIVVSLFSTYLQRKDRKIDDLNSIIVLPIINESADLNNRYLCNEITDGIIGNLSHISELRVIARDTAFSYADKKVDIRKVGQDVDVRVVLTGTISDRGNKLITHINVNRASDGSQLFDKEYERERSDTTAAQIVINNISKDVALRLTNRVHDFPQGHYIADTQARDLYSRGHLLLAKRNVPDLNRSIDFFQQSLQRDPQNAQAQAAIADAYILLGSLGYSALSPEIALPRAREAALKALAIDNSCAEALTSMALIEMLLDWDWTGAETDFKRAIKLNPNYATAYHWYANYLAARKRFNEAETQIKIAQQIDPRSLIIRATVGWILYFEGRYDEAITQCKETIEMQSDFYPAHAFLGFAYEQKNQFAEALEEFKIARAISNDNPVMIAEVARLQARLGNKDVAVGELERLKKLSTQRYVPADSIAIIYAELGDLEQAFAWLEKAYGDHATGLIQLKVEPKLNILRSDPRFMSLIERLGLN